MEPDDLLCYCFRVTKRKVVNFIRQRRPKRASQVSECFGAGTGCGWCIPFLIRLHREVMAAEGDAASILEADDISPEEYERLRLEYQRDLLEGRASRNRYRSGSASGEESSAGTIDESLPVEPTDDPDDPDEVV